jgi:cyclic pyranopterin phosphate synthase
MPEEPTFQPKDEILTFEELERLARILGELGVDRIRITGGEPTVRRDIVDLVARMARAPGLRDLSMTTNGWNLAQIGPALRDAGLTRVNISLDTLRRDRFVALARVDRLDEVLAGIHTVAAMGWLPLKINVVVCRGQNEDEAANFVTHFADLPVTIRFIEYMAFGEGRFPLVPWAEVRRRIEERHRLRPVDGPDGSGPARYWQVEGTQVTVGSIGARSEQFCAGCNRIRVTADGRIRTCLAYEPQMVSVRDVMRQGGSDEDLEWAIRAALLRKPWSHIHQEDGSGAFEGQMVRIGG